MELIELSPLDLSIAAVLVVLLALSSMHMRLGVTRPLVISSVRTVIQLLLVGLVLEAVFAASHPGWIALIALVMLAVAGYEVMARQQRRFAGWWGYGVGTVSMFVSTFAVTLFTLVVIIGNDPWYTPQYAIPLLGMMFGNTMNGISLALDRLTHSVWQQRAVIETRLALGHSARQAIADIRREATRSGMMPLINAMAAAGIVSMPGIMTGQILAGAPPLEAVKYQILIMFMLAAGTGFGTFAAIALGSRRVFDERHRLRLERLRPKNNHF